MQVTWVIDRYLLDDSRTPSLEDLCSAISASDHMSVVTEYVPFSQSNATIDGLKNNGPVVLYGTHGFIRQGRLNGFLIPGDYCHESELACSVWMPNFPRDMLLNSDYRFLPWTAAKLIELPVFMRPDSVTKTFGGKLVTCDSDIDKIDSGSVTDRTWVLLNAPVEILAEYRFFVVAGVVISGCQYRRDNKLDIRVDVSKTAQDMAEYVAKYGWQPDSCYVVDVADTVDGAKIIEFNSMSCAGMYACDPSAIVRAVSNQAVEDYKDALPR